MTDKTSIYFVSFYTFNDETNEQTFYKGCVDTLNAVRVEDGFLSAYGYRAMSPHVRYQYVGIAEFESMEAIYHLLDNHDLTAKLAPPEGAKAMTLLCEMHANTYTSMSSEFDPTADFMTLIHPLSLPVDQRDNSKAILELGRRNLMVFNSSRDFFGHRSFKSTVPTAVHNFVILQEWRSEEAYEAMIRTDAYKLANRGQGEMLWNTGIPEWYMMVVAYDTRRSIEMDVRFPALG